MLALVQLRRVRERPIDPSFAPAVSILVPAYNEAVGIARCVQSLAGSRYAGQLEVVVVDDGSADDTAAVVETLTSPDVRLIRQANAGKAAALNRALAGASHDILVTVDADTVFEPETLSHLVQRFREPCVWAISGNTKVGNRHGLVGHWQHIEYVMGFNLDRRAYEVIGATPTVPGAIGAFRRRALADIGGVSGATIAEDTDITLDLGRAGWKVVYEPRARAWTEAPSNLRALYRQRARWAYGTIQSAWKHRDRSLRGEHAFGRRAVGVLLVFQILLPLAAPLIDLFAIYSILFLDPMPILVFWGAFNLFQLTLAWVAFGSDGESRRPLWALPLQQLAWRQITYFVVLDGIISALLGRQVGWRHLRAHRVCGHGGGTPGAVMRRWTIGAVAAGAALLAGGRAGRRRAAEGRRTDRRARQPGRVRNDRPQARIRPIDGADGPRAVHRRQRERDRSPDNSQHAVMRGLESAVARVSDPRLQPVAGARSLPDRSRPLALPDVPDRLRRGAVRTAQHASGPVSAGAAGRVAGHPRRRAAQGRPSGRRGRRGVRDPAVPTAGCSRGRCVRAATTVDLAGGWFDAGDYLKFSGTASFTDLILLFTLREYGGRLPAPLPLVAEAHFGTDWLLKTWDERRKVLYEQVGLGDGNGNSVLGDHDIWRLPQRDDSYRARPLRYIAHRPVFAANRPGAPVSPNLAGREAAAFALCAQVFRLSDPGYAHRCLLAGQTLYDAAARSWHGRLAGSVPAAYYVYPEWRDDMELAATELYLATLYIRSADLPHREPYNFLEAASRWANGYQASARGGQDSLNLYDVAPLRGLRPLPGDGGERKHDGPVHECLGRDRGHA